MIGEITVTVVTVTRTTDKYGDATETTASRDVPGCLFAPQASLTRMVRAEGGDPHSPAVTELALVYMPAGEVVYPNDYLLIDAQRFEVLGEPSVWGSAGSEVAVRRWEQP